MAHILTRERLNRYEYFNFICTNIEQIKFNEKMVKTITNANIYNHIKNETSGKYGDFSNKMLQNLKYKMITDYHIYEKNDELNLYLKLSIEVDLKACNHNDMKNIVWWSSIGHCDHSPITFYEDDFQTMIDIEVPINLNISKQLYIDCYGDDDINDINDINEY